MPIVTIKYNLPEENEEYKTHMQAGRMSVALWEFAYEFLRGNLKHGLQESTIDEVIRELKYTVEDGSQSDKLTDRELELVTVTLEVTKKRFYEIVNSNDIEM